MKNFILELECIDVTNDGQGVCKNDGLVVFVKEMIPGERALVKIIAQKKNLAYGIIDELIIASPYRTKPDCPIAYKCGGCDLRHISYEYQLVLKKQVLMATFKNMGVEIKVNDIIQCDNPLNYRNKVQVPIRDGKFGFYRKFSNDIVEFDSCLLQTTLANKVFSKTRELIKKYNIENYFRHVLVKHGQGSGEVMLGLIVRNKQVPHIDELVNEIVAEFVCIKSIILNINNRNDNVVLGDEEIVLFGRDYIIDEFAGLKFKISFKSFYQVNYGQMVKLYSYAKEIAQLDKEAKVLDLFSGIGTISLFMAKYCREVWGVEIVEPAVLNARENAKLNNIDNAYFYLDDANCDLSKYLIDKDVVIVDPPRKGLNRELIDSIKHNKVKKIVYISCNPATLARDLSYLQDEYSFDCAQSFDMFPFTNHVETVVLITRDKKGQNS